MPKEAEIMSRSYRKYPCSRMTLWGKHNRSMKPAKQYSNRMVRKKLKNPYLEISNGKYYKYLGLDSWDIYEYKFYKSKQEVVREWECRQVELAYNIRTWKHYRDYTLEEELNEWKKYYMRK